MKHIILIPTYNEATNIEILLLRIMEHAPEVFIKVIDDNSPDGTAGIVRRLMSTYTNLSLLSRAHKEGLGKAYTHGFTEALKDMEVTHIIMMDADMSHDPRYLPEMIERSKTHDVVIGSRYINGGGVAGWEAWRKVLSFFGNLYARTVTRLPIKDLTAGFNCISVVLMRKISFEDIDSSGYAFIIELKCLLHRAGGQFFEIPIIFVNRTGGESKISSHIVSEGIVAPWKIARKTRAVHDTVRPVMSHEKTNCPWCDSEDVYFFTHKNKCDLYSCRSCGLLFVFPVSDSSAVYSAEYFSGAQNGFGYVDYDTDKEPMIPTFEKYLDLISSNLSFPPSRQLEQKNAKKYTFLDVGAATGFFMKLAEKRGFETVGVELSDFAAQKGRREGLQIVTGDLESAHFSDKHFDVVTLCDVLEHVPYPHEFILENARVLKDGGLLVVNTPDVESRVARILGPRWHLIVPPEHLHYFSPRNLGTYLEKNGFEIIISTKIGKRFTLEYIFKTLFKWQKLSFWNKLAGVFSKGSLSHLYVPINLYDNFFMIARKKYK